MTPREASMALIRAKTLATTMQKWITAAMSGPLGDVALNAQAAVDLLDDIRAELETVTRGSKRGARKR